MAEKTDEVIASSLGARLALRRSKVRSWPTVACRTAVVNGSSAAMDPVITTVRFAAKRTSDFSKR